MFQRNQPFESSEPPLQRGLPPMSHKHQPFVSSETHHAGDLPCRTDVNLSLPLNPRHTGTATLVSQASTFRVL